MYFRPTTLTEAVRALANPGAQILAGGTDFYPALGEGPVTGPIVDISAVNELRGITRDETHYRIGGLTTWTQLIRAALPPCFDGLKAAAREIGGVQIQNRGTVAGNLCNASPAADSVPPLLALHAEVELASPTGARRMPLREFIVGKRKTQRRPEEVLSQVLVPRTLERANSVFLKLGSRRYLVISIAMVAVVILKDAAGNVADACVSVGSCSEVAQRLPELEHALLGAPASEGLGPLATVAHLSGLAPIDDVRGTAAYRQEAALQLVQRALNACARAS